MSLFDRIKNKNLQEKKKDNPGDALRKAIGKQSELDAAKDFQKDVGKNITPELKNTLSKKQDNLNRFFTDQPDSKTLKTKPTGNEKVFTSKVKFDSGAKGKFVSGSPDLGGTQRKFVKDRRRKLDVEINKRRSAELTKSDAINRAMGGGPSTEGTGGANQGQLKKYKPPSKAESDAIQIRSTINKAKKFANQPGTSKSKGTGASTGGQKNLVVNPKSKGTTPVKVSTTKTIKQSDISKKAKKFTAKVNTANKNRKEFPGDKSGAYKQAKDDLTARTGFKGAKTQTGAGKTKTITGLKADEKNPFVKTSVRKGRAADLGGDIFDTPKVTDKDFKKLLKDVGKEGSKIKKARAQAFKDVQTDSPYKGTLPGSKPTFDKKSTFVKPEDPFKGATGKRATKGALRDFEFKPKTNKASQAAEKAKKSFAQFGKDLKKAKANIEIEKKVNRPSYKISSGSASSGGKSKGTGSRTTNVSGGGSSSSGGGNTSSSGSGSGGGSGTGGKGGILTPPGGSGGSGGGDGSGFRGKFDPGKQRITGNYDDVTAAKNMKWKNLARKLTGGGRKVDTLEPGYTPRKIKGYKFFTNKKLDAGQRAQKILQGRAIKKNLPKGLKFTKPLVQNIARNPGKYGKAGLYLGAAALAYGAYKKFTTPKPGQLTSKDFAGKVIKNRKGENVRFKYDTYNPTTKSTTSAKNLAGPVITNKELGKFKTGEYKLDGVDLNKRIQNSAFTKQLKDASKGTGLLGRQTDKDRKFLQKYQKAAERRNIKVPTKK